MIGPLLLLAAAAMPQSPTAMAAAQLDAFHPVPTARARATARILVISGVKFGEGYSAAPSGADRRSTQLTDHDGRVRSAELLEFQ